MKYIKYIYLAILVSPQIMAAPKVLECKWKNERITSCPTLEYTNSVTIVFDTDDLTKSESYAEFTNVNCTTAFIGDTFRVKMMATASTLSFVDDSTAIKFADPNLVMTWNVDRKTLKAGYGKSRVTSCILSDLDTSENQI